MNTPKRKSDIYEAIYDVVRLIPHGRVSSYGAIATAIGLRSGARMVGYAMNHSHTVLPKVPAHRVVNRNGLLTGKAHFGIGTEMEDLLNAEGVAVKEDKVVDFDKLQWEPGDLLED